MNRISKTLSLGLLAAGTLAALTACSPVSQHADNPELRWTANQTTQPVGYAQPHADAHKQPITAKEGHIPTTHEGSQGMATHSIETKDTQEHVPTDAPAGSETHAPAH